MKRYEKYKKSGVEWIGDIPEGWDRISFKYEIDILTDYTSNGSFKSLSDNVQYLELGYSRLVRLTDLRVNLTNDGIYVSENSHKYLKKSELFGGEILISCVGHYTGIVFKMLSGMGVCTLGPNMYLIKNKVKTTNVDFLVYLLNSDVIQFGLLHSINKTTQEKINKDNVKDLKILRPPLKEQEQIVAYLDEKTSHIDKLLDVSKRKIGLLKEQRASIINQVITKGLNPNAKMKNSGVEWIGDIPEGWGVKRMKYFTQSKKEKSEDGLEELLSVSEHNGVIPRRNIREIDEVFTRAESLVGYLKVKKGELVSNIMLMWKRGLGVSEYDGIVSPAYSVFSFHKSFPKYFHFLFRTNQYIAEFKRNSTGVIESRLRLYDDVFGAIYSHYPPLKEQEQIVAYLDEKTSTIDKSISIEERRIGLLKEYRQSIISQVITGKIKVIADE